jgi:hypothetical protein
VFAGRPIPPNHLLITSNRVIVAARVVTAYVSSFVPRQLNTFNSALACLSSR